MVIPGSCTEPPQPAEQIFRPRWRPADRTTGQRNPHGDLQFFGDQLAFTYKPNTDFTGQDSFTYKVNDGFLDSNVATVTLIIS
jgi:hypothetical protein